MKRPLLLILVIVGLVLIAIYMYNLNKTVDEYFLNMDAQKEAPLVTSTTPSATTTTSRVRGPVDMKIAVGKTMTDGDVSITINDFLNDYRCPIDVQCIQAGAVVVNVTIVIEGKEVTRNFPSDEVPFQFQGYAIAITDIKPDLYSHTPIPKDAYRITFHVVPTAKGETL